MANDQKIVQMSIGSLIIALRGHNEDPFTKEEIPEEKADLLASWIEDKGHESGACLSPVEEGTLRLMLKRVHEGRPITYIPRRTQAELGNGPTIPAPTASSTLDENTHEPEPQPEEEETVEKISTTGAISTDSITDANQRALYEMLSELTTGHAISRTDLTEAYRSAYPEASPVYDSSFANALQPPAMNKAYTHDALATIFSNPAPFLKELQSMGFELSDQDVTYFSEALPRLYAPVKSVHDAEQKHGFHFKLNDDLPPNRRALAEAFLALSEAGNADLTTFWKATHDAFYQELKKPLSYASFDGSVRNIGVKKDGKLHDYIQRIIEAPEAFIDALKAQGVTLNTTAIDNFTKAMEDAKSIIAEENMPKNTIGMRISEDLTPARHLLAQRMLTLIDTYNISTNDIWHATDASLPQGQGFSFSQLSNGLRTLKGGADLNIPGKLQTLFKNPDPFLDTLKEKGYTLSDEHVAAFKDNLDTLLETANQEIKDKKRAAKETSHAMG